MQRQFELGTKMLNLAGEALEALLKHFGWLRDGEFTIGIHAER